MMKLDMIHNKSYLERMRRLSSESVNSITIDLYYRGGEKMRCSIGRRFVDMGRKIG